jgi:hypothetical protein
VQISVCDVDENGKMIIGSNTHFPLSGFVRSQAESDDSLNRLATKQGREYIRRFDEGGRRERSAERKKPEGLARGKREASCAHDSLHPTQNTLHRGLDSIYMTSEE